MTPTISTDYAKYIKPILIEQAVKRGLSPSKSQATSLAKAVLITLLQEDDAKRPSEPAQAAQDAPEAPAATPATALPAGALYAPRKRLPALTAAQRKAKVRRNRIKHRRRLRRS
jgi:hypothetical protein